MVSDPSPACLHERTLGMSARKCGRTSQVREAPAGRPDTLDHAVSRPPCPMPEPLSVGECQGWRRHWRDAANMAFLHLVLDRSRAGQLDHQARRSFPRGRSRRGECRRIRSPAMRRSGKAGRVDSSWWLCDGLLSGTAVRIAVIQLPAASIAAQARGGTKLQRDGIGRVDFSKAFWIARVSTRPINV